MEEKKIDFNVQNALPVFLMNQLSMVDLHGRSPIQSQTVINRMLAQSAETNTTEFRFVTGRGKHKNKKGERGTLHREFIDWISEENRSQISSIKKEIGHYEISIKPLSKSKSNKLRNFLDNLGRKNYADNINYIIKSAEQGEAEAQYLLGYCYQFGIGVEQNEKLAVKWYRVSAEQKYPLAQYALGGCYFQGQGVKQNDDKAIRLFEIAAQNGVGLAFHQLGDVYEYGWGVEKDCVKAVEYYQKASDLGVDLAKRKLGHAYFYGKGIEKDEKKGFLLYKEVADRGDSFSAYNVACCYLNAEGIESSIPLAFKYANKAAENNDPDAQYLLSLYYHEKCGIEPEANKSLAYLKLSAAAQHTQALFDLAFHPEINPDKKLQLEYLIKSAKAGHIVGCAMILAVIPQSLLETINFTIEDKNNLLEQFWRLSDEKLLSLTDKKQKTIVLDAYLKNDHLTAKQKKKILRLLHALVQEQFVPAFGRLGQIYMEGVLIKRDLQRAKKYWLEGAELSSRECFCSLGYFYETGQEGPPDYEKAFYYHQKAAELGNANSHNQLGLIYANSYGVEFDFDKAIYHFQRAIELDSPENKIQQYNGLFYTSVYVHAALNLGGLFWNVLSLPGGTLEDQKKVITMAIYWFLKAQAAGSVEAQHFLQKAGFYEKDQKNEPSSYQASPHSNFWTSEKTDLQKTIINPIEQLQELTEKIGFETNWKITKENKAWCYIPESKLKLLDQYDIKPAELRKTKEGKYILLIEQLDKQDLQSLQKRKLDLPVKGGYYN